MLWLCWHRLWREQHLESSRFQGCHSNVSSVRRTASIFMCRWYFSWFVSAGSLLELLRGTKKDENVPWHWTDVMWMDSRNVEAHSSQPLHKHDQQSSRTEAWTFLWGCPSTLRFVLWGILHQHSIKNHALIVAKKPPWSSSNEIKKVQTKIVTTLSSSAFQDLQNTQKIFLCVHSS